VLRLLFSVLFLAPVFAADPATIPIWPDDSTPSKETYRIGPNDQIRRVIDVTRPTLAPMLPPEGKGNGAAVLVLPGGGFRHLAIDKEGHDVGRWLNSLGVAAFVIRYRVMRTGKDSPADRDEAQRSGFRDVQEALRIVRSRAKEWKIDPRKIGVIGFSAGGYHAAMAASHYTAENRPDFALCIYPAAPANIEFPEDAPPLFLLAADDDRLEPRLHAVPIYVAAKKAKIPAELHIVGRGGHGFGMVKSNAPTDTWIDRAQEWLTDRGLLR
jgi:acetyl esterase/lipase